MATTPDEEQDSYAKVYKVIVIVAPIAIAGVTGLVKGWCNKKGEASFNQPLIMKCRHMAAAKKLYKTANGCCRVGFKNTEAAKTFFMNGDLLNLIELIDNGTLVATNYDYVSTPKLV